MTQRDPLPEFLEGARRNYVAFLNYVRLLPRDAPREHDVDGLHHAELRTGQQSLLLDPYRLNIRTDQPPDWFVLSWQNEEALRALSSTVTSLGTFCNGVSRRAIRESLLGLLSEFLEEERLSDKVFTELNKQTDGGSMKATNGISIGPFLTLPDLRQRLHNLVMRLLKRVTPYVVFVPVEGLELSRSIKVGDVSFEVREIDSEIEEMMDIMQEMEGTKSIKWIREEVIPERDVKCFARTEIKGESTYVIQDAKERVSNALNVLSLCIPSHFHRPAWAKIRVADVVILRRNPSQRLQDDFMSYHYTLPPGHLKNLNWNNLVDAIGARSTPSFASKPDWKRKPEQEDAIVQQALDGLYDTFHGDDAVSGGIGRALIWYSKAMSFSDPSEQFVGLAIALDSLIGRRGQSTDITRASALSITQTIAERVAFLLGKDFEERTEKYSEAARLYGLRSKIVHEGLPVSENDVFDLEELVKDVILFFYAKGFRGWEDVEKWVNKQVFTTGTDLSLNGGEEEE